ncbi:MAG: TIGR00296 family protein [Candidatus Aenigmatarchaeota archaeon]
MALKKSEGEACVKIAREAVELWARKRKVLKPAEFPERLKEPSGVFVTLTKHEKLRGCIGHPYPAGALLENLIDSAIAACGDPRFQALRESELKDIRIEVSILTPPELIKRQSAFENYEKFMEVGKDGLIITRGSKSGLLLPQVATEYKMGAKQFLDCLLDKAGMGRDEASGARIYKFRAQIFRELKG